MEYNRDGHQVRWQRINSSPDTGCDSVEYDVDYAGRPTRIVGTPADCSQTQVVFAESIKYLPWGPIETLSTPVYDEVLAYDGRFRLVLQTATLLSGTTIVERSYDCDGGKLISSVADALDSTRDRTFEYDVRGRLTSTTGPYGSIAYSYDDLGNRSERTIIDGLGTSSMTFDYVSGTSKIYEITETLPGQTPQAYQVEHDEYGNITDDGSTSIYSYGPRNTMTHLKERSTEAITHSFLYDAAGYRAFSSEVGGESVVRYSHGEQHLDAAGVPVEEKLNVLLNSRLLATSDIDGDVAYIVSDHIGFPMVSVAGDGSVLWSSDSLPFGEAGEVTGGDELNDPLRRFPGQWQYTSTPTPLVYNGFRWYRPDWGRYTQTDPLGYAPPRVIYGYAENNPLGFIDINGLKCTPWRYHDGAEQYKSTSHCGTPHSFEDFIAKLFPGGITNYCCKYYKYALTLRKTYIRECRCGVSDDALPPVPEGWEEKGEYSLKPWDETDTDAYGCCTRKQTATFDGLDITDEEYVYENCETVEKSCNKWCEEKSKGK
jgi:RHS repeat-associated protein